MGTTIGLLADLKTRFSSGLPGDESTDIRISKSSAGTCVEGAPLTREFDPIANPASPTIAAPILNRRRLDMDIRDSIVFFLPASIFSTDLNGLRIGTHHVLLQDATK
ncbi:MAG: hypothetical protein CMJ54_10465 [Planctomycetaceae bacterium]|nr:hypothetical protein [Planctomycetaceae bacterium]